MLMESGVLLGTGFSRLCISLDSMRESLPASGQPRGKGGSVGQNFFIAESEYTYNETSAAKISDFLDGPK